jgi:hypothetical protein
MRFTISILLAFFSLLSFSAVAQRIQVIHAIPGGDEVKVNVSVNNSVVADSVGFLGASAALQGIVGVNTVSITLTNNPTDTLKTSVRLAAGGFAYIIAKGIIGDTANYAGNPDNIRLRHELIVLDASAAVPAGKVNLYAAHAISDAPTLSVAKGETTLISDWKYKTIVKATTAIDTSAIDLEVLTGTTPLLGLNIHPTQAAANQRVLLLASGFINPMANDTGVVADFRLYMEDGSSKDVESAISAVQFIHNSPDPAVADAQLTFELKNLPNIPIDFSDTLKFRQGSAYLSIPAFAPLRIHVRNPANPDSILATFDDVYLRPEVRYVIMINGVADASKFKANPDRVEISLSVSQITNPQLTVPTPRAVALHVIHGCTDAPKIDVGVRQLNNGRVVTNLGYGGTAGPLTVMRMDYTLDVYPTGTPTPNALVSYSAPLTTLMQDTSFIIFASGFLDNNVQNQRDKPFGLYVLSARGGDAIRLDTVAKPQTPAVIRIVHAAPDPVLSNVQAELVTKDGISLGIGPLSKIPLSFLQSGLIDLPLAPEIMPLKVRFFNEAGTTKLDSFPNVTFPAGSSNIVLTSGVVDPSKFVLPNDSRNAKFKLVTFANARKVSTVRGKVQVAVFHAAVNAPAVRIRARGATSPLIENLGYEAFSQSSGANGYLDLDPATYILEVVNPVDESIVASYQADLLTQTDKALMIIAAGLLNPVSDQSPFGLFVYDENNRITALPFPTSRSEADKLFAQRLAYPNPANESIFVRYSLQQATDARIELTDLQGRVVLTQDMGKQLPGVHTPSIDVSNLNSGMYFYRLVSGNTATSAGKVLIQR